MRIFKIVIVFALVILSLLFTLESGLFLKIKKIPFSLDAPIEGYEYRKFPDYFSPYGAEISTSIEYKKNNISPNQTIVHSYFYPHKSFIKFPCINSPEVLEHEMYHFKITELFARKMQRRINLPKQELSNTDIDSIYKTIIKETIELQEVFDNDTRHGQLEIVQKEWYSIIDTLLEKTRESSTFYLTNDTYTPIVDSISIPTKPTLEYFCAVLFGEKNIRLQLEYYDNKNIRSEAIYRNNKADGHYLEWYENGNLSKFILYKNGVRQGDYCFYDRYGNIIEKGE